MPINLEDCPNFILNIEHELYDFKLPHYIATFFSLTRFKTHVNITTSTDCYSPIDDWVRSLLVVLSSSTEISFTSHSLLTATVYLSKFQVPVNCHRSLPCRPSVSHDLLGGYIRSGRYHTMETLARICLSYVYRPWGALPL